MVATEVLLPVVERPIVGSESGVAIVSDAVLFTRDYDRRENEARSYFYEASLHQGSSVSDCRSFPITSYEQLSDTDFVTRVIIERLAVISESVN